MPIFARSRRSRNADRRIPTGTSTDADAARRHRRPSAPVAGSGALATALQAIANFVYPQLPQRQGLVQVAQRLLDQFAAGRECGTAALALGIPVASVQALCNVASALGLDIIGYLRTVI